MKKLTSQHIKSQKTETDTSDFISQYAYIIRLTVADTHKTTQYVIVTVRTESNPLHRIHPIHPIPLLIQYLDVQIA